MCELLFFAKDRVSDDPYTDAKCYKRGFVVVVKPDGWNWSTQELRNPDWRIVKAPNITVVQASSVLSPEAETDPANPSRVLQRRGFKFDIDDAMIPAAARTWLGDDSRAEPFFTVLYTIAQFSAFIKANPKLIDPNIL